MTDRQYPPGPRGHWLLGNLRLLRRNILHLLEELPQQYGDIVHLRFGAYRALLLSHPAFVEQVLVTQNRIFQKPPRFRRLVRPAFGNGLFANQGASWVQQRRTMQSVLETIDLDEHVAVVARCARTTVASWQNTQDDGLVDRLVELALVIRVRTTLGIDRTDAFNSIHQAVQRFMDYYATSLQSPVGWPRWMPTASNWKMHAALRQWWTAIEHQVDHAASAEATSSHMLSELFRVRPAMPRRQLRDELATWLLTGTETTANTLAWACYLLALHPNKQQQLFDELQASCPGCAVQRTDLTRLKFLAGVLSETMRLYPQAYLLGRKSTASFAMDQYQFPKRTTVILNQWSIGRDPRWFDNPSDFDPERWSGDLASRLPRFAFFPFGGGPRICIGRPLAQLDLPIVLAILVQQFWFELSPGGAG